MSFNSKRQEELNKQDMFASATERREKQKIAPKKSYKDLSVIPDYDEKMNMLAPGSFLSKIIGAMIVVGLVLYFCNIYIGFWIVIAGVVMYFGLWLVLRIKEKKAKKNEEKKEE